MSALAQSQYGYVSKRQHLNCLDQVIWVGYSLKADLLLLIFISGIGRHGMFPYQGYNSNKSSNRFDMFIKNSAFYDGLETIVSSGHVRVLIPEMSCHLELTYI